MPQDTIDLLPNTYDLIAKSIMCGAVSALKNAENPGTFDVTRNHLLRAHNIPKFTLGRITAPVIHSLSTPLSESTSIIKCKQRESEPRRGSDQDVNPTYHHYKRIFFKEGNTPKPTPGNIRELHTGGHVVIECSKGSTAAFFRRLESATLNDVDQLVDIVDLKDKVFVKQVKN